MNWIGCLAVAARLCSPALASNAPGASDSIQEGLTLGNTLPESTYSEMNLSPGTIDLQSNQPYWLESIPHRGTAAYNGDKSYKVFRNVKVRLRPVPLAPIDLVPL